jgi:hypothetical protein
MGVFQTARQPVLFCWDGNEVNVIRHQTIADQFDPVSLHTLAKQIEINPAFRFSFQDDAASVAALGYVMGNAWRNHPGKSNH